MRSTRLLALALFALPQLASAQTATTLAPGDARMDGSRIKPGRYSMELVVTQAGKDQPSMHAEVAIRRVTVEGNPALEFVQVFHSPRGTGVDTSVVLSAGMKPVRHRSSGMGRSMALDFAGNVVTGKTSAAGAAEQPFRNETAEPTFDSGALDLILAAAPLSAGFKARLPMYIHEQKGLVWHDIAVVGEEAVDLGGAAVPAWQVEVKTTVYTATYLIGKQNREALGVRAARDNMSFRMVRKVTT